MARAYNKSDYPLKSINQLAEQVSWDKYEYKDKFKYACTATPNANEEVLQITDENKPIMKKSCAYVIVINNRIFKIGSALRGIKDRIGSYNTGRTRYRTAGTNSGTNFWCLQSFIKIAEPVKFYIYYPSMRKTTIFGESISEPFPSAKSIEAVVIRKFEQKYGAKPIGCTQG